MVLLDAQPERVPSGESAVCDTRVWRASDESRVHVQASAVGMVLMNGTDAGECGGRLRLGDDDIGCLEGVGGENQPGSREEELPGEL